MNWFRSKPFLLKALFVAATLMWLSGGLLVMPALLALFEPGPAIIWRIWTFLAVTAASLPLYAVLFALQRAPAFVLYGISALLSVMWIMFSLITVLMFAVEQQSGGWPVVLGIPALLGLGIVAAVIVDVIRRRRSSVDTNG